MSCNRNSCLPLSVSLPNSSHDSLHGRSDTGPTFRDALASTYQTSRKPFIHGHSELPYALLGRASNRIINEVRGINRVVYDVSGKPPATIEWE
nr:hypothetical protein [Microvirgula aerodenitrificans]